MSAQTAQLENEPLGRGRDELQATGTRLEADQSPWISTAKSRGKQLVPAYLTQSLLLVHLLLVNFPSSGVSLHAALHI